MNPKRITRYTTLPVLLDLLKQKHLVMLDPRTWEDKNDSRIIEEYKRRKGLSKLFALCFSRGDETIHHWKTYAEGIGGCLIEFDGHQLVESIKEIEGVRFDSVRYKFLREVEKKKIKVDDIPFTKRWQYRCEEEWRMIWEGNSEAAFYKVPIDLRIINKITISQKMPRPVYATIKALLRSSFSDPDKKIHSSTLFENERWISQFKNK